MGTWHRHKLTLLASRGIERLVLAFDGDEAGLELSEQVVEEAAGAFETVVIDFPDGQDPGDCGARTIRQIARCAM